MANICYYNKNQYNKIHNIKSANSAYKNEIFEGDKPLEHLVQ